MATMTRREMGLMIEAFKRVIEIYQRASYGEWESHYEPDADEIYEEAHDYFLDYCDENDITEIVD